MSTFGYFVLGVVAAIYIVRWTDYLASKFNQHILLPAWEMVRPRPGGKLWAVTRAVKGN